MKESPSDTVELRDCTHPITNDRFTCSVNSKFTNQLDWPSWTTHNCGTRRTSPCRAQAIRRVLSGDSFRKTGGSDSIWHNRNEQKDRHGNGRQARNTRTMTKIRTKLRTRARNHTVTGCAVIATTLRPFHKTGVAQRHIQPGRPWRACDPGNQCYRQPQSDRQTRNIARLLRATRACRTPTNRVTRTHRNLYRDTLHRS